MTNFESQSEFQAGEDFAIAMDERDPLNGYRDRFLLPKTTGGECVYLCGHSLGLQPKTAAAYVQQELKDWAELGVEATSMRRTRGCPTTDYLPNRQRNW